MPFDISYRINPQTLREEANNADDIRRAMHHHHQQAMRPNLEPLLKIHELGMTGNFARLVHEFALAEECLTEAVMLCETYHHQRYLFINRIRLATVYQWMGNFEASTALFDELLKNPIAGLEDFVLQHAGKNAFEMLQYEKALGYFQSALKIRMAKGVDELINSTQLAIAETNRRLDAQSHI